MSVTFGKETITPKKAAAWLKEANKGNRKVSYPTVDKIASDIKDGRWRFTGDAIRFNGNGKLIDGQHRLTAIVTADTPVESLVIRGLDSEAKFAIDIGKKRTVSDMLHYLGYKDRARHATVARFCQLMLAESMDVFRSGRKAPTVQQTVAFIEDNRTALENAIRATYYNGKTFPFHAAKTPLAGIHVLTRESNPGECAAFCQQVFVGAGLEVGSPALALRKWLENAYIGDTRARSSQIHAIVIKAWNAFIEGRDVERLTHRVGGANADTFPTISTGVEA